MARMRWQGCEALMVDEPDEIEEPSWRIRAGCGLVADMRSVMSESQWSAIQRESEKERLQAERAAEMQAQVAAEHRGELLMRGVVPTSVDERLQAVGFAQDRQDRRDMKADEQYKERFGHGRPRQWPALLDAAKSEREAKAAAAEATPASEAAVERKFEKLKTTIENTFGKRLLK
jgi:hypothetical protein